MITNLNWLQPKEIGHFKQFVFTVYVYQKTNL